MLAFILVVVGVLLIFLSSLSSEEHKPGEKHVEGGGVIVIGPLPVVIGTSERITKVLIALAIALFLVVLITYLVITGWL